MLPQFLKASSSRSDATLTCPRCAEAITGTGLNAATDQAACQAPGCGWVGKLSTVRLEEELQIDRLDIDPPPPRCRFANDYDGFTASIPATKRTAAIFPLLFAAFWWSILTVFLVFVTAQTLFELGLLEEPLVEPQDPDGFDSVWVMWIFLVPFVLVGTGMLGLGLFQLCGRLQITGSRGELRSGYRLFGIPLPPRRSIDLEGLESVAVAEQVSSVRVNGRPLHHILAQLRFEDRPPVGLARWPPPAATAWLIALLRDRLLARSR